jgi:hypothetical protein
MALLLGHDFTFCSLLGICSFPEPELIGFHAGNCLQVGAPKRADPGPLYTLSFRASRSCISQASVTGKPEVTVAADQIIVYGFGRLLHMPSTLPA